MTNKKIQANNGKLLLGDALSVDHATGRIGIGTDNPNSYNVLSGQIAVIANTEGETSLSIVSNSTNNGNILFADGTTGDDRRAGRIAYSHSSNTMFFFTNGNNTRAVIDSTGNVGIGTTSPGSNKVAISAVSATAQLAFGRTSTNQGHGVIGATATSAFELYTGGTATDAVLAGSALMSVTHAGAVTLGPSGFTGAHTVHGFIGLTRTENISSNGNSDSNWFLIRKVSFFSTTNFSSTGALIDVLQFGATNGEGASCRIHTTTKRQSTTNFGRVAVVSSHNMANLVAYRLDATGGDLGGGAFYVWVKRHLGYSFINVFINESGEHSHAQNLMTDTGSSDTPAGATVI